MFLIRCLFPSKPTAPVRCAGDGRYSCGGRDAAADTRSNRIPRGKDEARVHYAGDGRFAGDARETSPDRETPKQEMVGAPPKKVVATTFVNVQPLRHDGGQKIIDERRIAPTKKGGRSEPKRQANAEKGGKKTLPNKPQKAAPVRPDGQGRRTVEKKKTPNNKTQQSEASSQDGDQQLTGVDTAAKPRLKPQKTRASTLGGLFAARTKDEPKLESSTGDTGDAGLGWGAVYAEAIESPVIAESVAPESVVEPNVENLVNEAIEQDAVDGEGGTGQSKPPQLEPAHHAVEEGPKQERKPGGGGLFGGLRWGGARQSKPPQLESADDTSVVKCKSITGAVVAECATRGEEPAKEQKRGIGALLGGFSLRRSMLGLVTKRGPEETEAEVVEDKSVENNDHADRKSSGDISRMNVDEQDPEVKSTNRLLDYDHCSSKASKVGDVQSQANMKEETLDGNHDELGLTVTRAASVGIIEREVSDWMDVKENDPDVKEWRQQTGKLIDFGGAEKKTKKRRRNMSADTALDGNKVEGQLARPQQVLKTSKASAKARSTKGKV